MEDFVRQEKSNKNLEGKLRKSSEKTDETITEKTLEFSLKTEKKSKTLEKPSNTIDKQNKLFCAICTLEFPVEETLTLECDHRFCKGCLFQDWQNKIYEGSIGEFLLICPQVGCTRPVNFYTLKEHLTIELFEKYENLLLKHDL